MKRLGEAVYMGIASEPGRRQPFPGGKGKWEDVLLWFYSQRWKKTGNSGKGTCFIIHGHITKERIGVRDGRSDTNRVS